MTDPVQKEVTHIPPEAVSALLDLYFDGVEVISVHGLEAISPKSPTGKNLKDFEAIVGKLLPTVPIGFIVNEILKLLNGELDEFTKRHSTVEINTTNLLGQQTMLLSKINHISQVQIGLSIENAKAPKDKSFTVREDPTVMH